MNAILIIAHLSPAQQLRSNQLVKAMVPVQRNLWLRLANYPTCLEKLEATYLSLLQWSGELLVVYWSGELYSA